MNDCHHYVEGYILIIHDPAIFYGALVIGDLMTGSDQLCNTATGT